MDFLKIRKGDIIKVWVGSHFKAFFVCVPLWLRDRRRGDRSCVCWRYLFCCNFTDLCYFSFWSVIWDTVFKNGSSKICGKQALNICLNYFIPMLHFYTPRKCQKTNNVFHFSDTFFHFQNWLNRRYQASSCEGFNCTHTPPHSSSFRDVLYRRKYSRIGQVKFFKACFPLILLGPFLNTLSPITRVLHLRMS